MHELSLLDGLMKKIEEIAHAENAKAVTRVRVRIGALAHISADHFREHFDQAARGTLAEGAAVDALVSTDEQDPQAQDIVLESIDVTN